MNIIGSLQTKITSCGTSFILFFLFIPPLCCLCYGLFSIRTSQDQTFVNNDESIDLYMKNLAIIIIIIIIINLLSVCRLCVPLFFSSKNYLSYKDTHTHKHRQSSDKVKVKHMNNCMLNNNLGKEWIKRVKL